MGPREAVSNQPRSPGQKHGAWRLRYFLPWRWPSIAGRSTRLGRPAVRQHPHLHEGGLLEDGRVGLEGHVVLVREEVDAVEGLPAARRRHQLLVRFVRPVGAATRGDAREQQRRALLRSAAVRGKKSPPPSPPTRCPLEVFTARFRKSYHYCVKRVSRQDTQLVQSFFLTLICSAARRETAEGLHELSPRPFVRRQPGLLEEYSFFVGLFNTPEKLVIFFVVRATSSLHLGFVGRHGHQRQLYAGLALPRHLDRVSHVLQSGNTRMRLASIEVSYDGYAQ